MAKVDVKMPEEFLLKLSKLGANTDVVAEKVLKAAAEKCKAFLSVEMSQGQMVEDVRLAVNGKKPVYFYGRNGGVVPSPDEICAEIEKIVGGMK